MKWKAAGIHSFARKIPRNLKMPVLSGGDFFKLSAGF
jgi:hypothetical protein